jgi:uncharacterized membrane protein
MNQPLIFLLTLTSMVGCGLMAGTFFAFSAFIMRALARLPAPQGIAAMQSINVVVLNPLFIGVFVGTAMLCAGLSIHALVTPSRPGTSWLLVGCALYIVGNFIVTRAYNIPRNNALAAVDPSSVEAAKLWADYLVTWTTWNHVRTVTAAVAMASLAIALWMSRASQTAP